MRNWLWSRWQLRPYRELASHARDGDRVRVTGIVRAADDTLIAPLSGRPCIAHISTARPYGGAPDRRVPPVVSQSRLRPFYVETERARVLVVGEDARLEIANVELADHDERKQQFLALHALAKRTARFSEVILVEGMRATVGGTLLHVTSEEPPRGERGFRDAPPLEPRIVGSRDAPLLIIVR